MNLRLYMRSADHLTPGDYIEVKGTFRYVARVDYGPGNVVTPYVMSDLADDREEPVCRYASNALLTVGVPEREG